jgi:menaquinol-cytochrome c reductase iron-sulfur subunit
MELNSMQMLRRRFLMLISIGAGAAVAAAASVPIVGFLISPMKRKYPPLWQDVGPLDHFNIGDTVQVNLVVSNPLPWDGPAQRIAAWLRRDNEKDFTVYSSKCTHLGCPVRWIASAELFMCPCHGGVYFKNGDVAAGPPPKPLQQFAARVLDGQVQVQWKVEQVQYSKLDLSRCPGSSRGNNNRGNTNVEDEEA